jgi:hypothetical protein
MSRAESRGVWDTLLIVAVAALAVTFTHARRAAADEEHQDGRIVELSPSGGANHEVEVADKAEEAAENQAPERPAYWLGLQGGPIDSELLRTHLQLADDVGVVIQNVVPDSPAEKAGLRKHDVLLEVGGQQISDMTVLQSAVAESEGKPIELKLIRLAKEMTIEVTPEKAPADMPMVRPQQFQQLHGDLPMERLREMLRQLPQENGVGGFRVFGPGMMGGGARLDLGRLPGGVSVKITREDDGPAKITVQKGDETWTVEGDDKEALEKLPEDVRPFVEQMLDSQHGGAGLFNFDGSDVQAMLPGNLGQFDFNVDLDGLQGQARERAGAAVRRAEDASKRLMDRMERLEKQLEKLQERLHEESPAENGNAAADPSNT